MNPELKHDFDDHGICYFCQSMTEHCGINDRCPKRESLPVVIAKTDDDIDTDWLQANKFDNVEVQKWHPKTGKWDKYTIWDRNGLYLTFWTDHWRWQVGGTDNMWECLHTPTKATIRYLLQVLDVSWKELISTIADLPEASWE